LPLSFPAKGSIFAGFLLPRLWCDDKAMSIDAQTVRHVATLARLQVSAPEVEAYAEQLSRILTLMETLSQLPTDGVEPMSHAVEMAIPERDDQVLHSNQREALLACAPEAEQGHFRVPKIIE
jgi:aspartyl-tRNA(Asn)/glutamyl-tRNA(Gln) amidotransferase subunit C